jgi:SAM-dependent methyltransferase
MAAPARKAAQPTRFVGNTTRDYQRYLRTAQEYVVNLRGDESLGLYQKPCDWNTGHPTFFQEIYQVLNILRSMALPPGARVAEIGSGAGWLTEMLLGLGYEVWAVEPSEEMLAVARQRVDSYMRHHRFPAPYKVRFFCESIENCTLPDDSVDAVLFHESLHHVIDEDRTLSECRRVLRPGGVLGTSGESNWQPGNREQEAFWEAEMARFGTLESPFTYEYLHRKLVEHGFTDVTRYHGINLNVPVSQENATIKQLANYPAQSLNNITARKPLGVPSTTDPGTVAHAAISVLSARLTPDRRQVRLRVRLHNSGRVAWAPDAAQGGYVTVALCGKGGRGSQMVEAVPRARLPRPVLPGQEIEVEHVYALPAGADDLAWSVDLVNEHRYWFSAQGSAPAPVRLDAA